MLADLDETLRQFLIHYAPLDTAEVDISFETPDREWSSRLSRPTVNCFLYDLRENHDLRQTNWDVSRENGSYVRRKEPLRFDVTYQVSVWAQAAEDEHRLLWHVLATLARHPFIPEDAFQGEVREQPISIPARVAQPDEGPRNMAELWQGIDNRVRPTVTYITTVSLDPNVVSVGPLVLRRSTRTLQLPQRDPLPDAVNPEIVDPTFGGRRLQPAQAARQPASAQSAPPAAAAAVGTSAAPVAPEAPSSPASRQARTAGTQGTARTQATRGNRPRPAN